MHGQQTPCISLCKVQAQLLQILCSNFTSLGPIRSQLRDLHVKFANHSSPPSILHALCVLFAACCGFYLHSRYAHRLFIAREGTALDALPAVYDSVGKEERDANARYRLLLDIQDAFSQHSNLIASYKVGSKDFHNCFSGASFIKWLRDEGAKHLDSQSLDLSHEGANGSVFRS